LVSTRSAIPEKICQRRGQHPPFGRGRTWRTEFKRRGNHIDAEFERDSPARAEARSARGGKKGGRAHLKQNRTNKKKPPRVEGENSISPRKVTNELIDPGSLFLASPPEKEGSHR